jgi:hypothetical protein
MKTAIEQLIEEMRSYSYKVSKEGNLDMIAAFEYAIGIAKKYKEKEKEQIITDYSNGLLYALGYKHQDKNIDYGVTMQSKAEADIYYNQTYNQTNVGNDGFEFDNSSTIPPPKTNNL